MDKIRPDTSANEIGAVHPELTERAAILDKPLERRCAREWAEWATRLGSGNVRNAGHVLLALEAALVVSEQQQKRLRELAKNAKVIAASPDYHEPSIIAALWAVVDAALSPSTPEENNREAL